MQDLHIALVLIGVFQSVIMTLGLFILKDLRTRIVVLETRQLEHAERITRLEGGS